MKLLSFLSVTTFAIMATYNSNAQTGNNNWTPDNPFYAESKLFLQAPDFNRIKNSDFQPALEEGMKERLDEMQKIADNPEKPTFENTFVAMEKTGQLLKRVEGVLNLLAGANTNPDLEKLQETEAPKLAANDDAVYLNTKLFKRVEAVYKERNTLQLDAESKRLVEYYYQKFELAGARLSDADKESLKILNKEEASLAAKYTNQLLAAAKAGALVVNDKVALAGFV